MPTTTKPTYKSPRHKLVAFFEWSRDVWRHRAREYHERVRALEVRVRDLEGSRDHWRQKYFAERVPESEARAHRGHEPPTVQSLARRSLTTRAVVS